MSTSMPNLNAYRSSAAQGASRVAKPSAASITPAQLADRNAALADTTAIAQLSTDHVANFLATGQLPSSSGSRYSSYDYGYGNEGLSLGNISSRNVQTSGDNVAVMLSDEGKKVLAQQGGPSLDTGLKNLRSGRQGSYGYGDQLMLGQRVQEAPTFDPAQHVQSILGTPEQLAQIQQQYADAVKNGKAPAQIGSQSYQDFFKQKAQPTDDLYATLETQAFERQVPGFSDLPAQAKKPVATLASMLAASYPESVPADVRRRVAFTKMDYHRVPWGTVRGGFGKDAQVMDFYHGNTNSLVALTNFAGDPKTLLDKLPDSVKEKYHLKNFHTTEAYGPGVYTGNPSVAGGYAMGKLNGSRGQSGFGAHSEVQKPIYVVNGKLNVAGEVQDDLDKHPEAHTRVVPDVGDMGPYRVTRNAWTNMRVTGITKLDPNASAEAALPDLLNAYRYDPQWATEQLATVSPKHVAKGVAKAQAKGALDGKAGQQLLSDVTKKRAMNGVEVAGQNFLDDPSKLEKALSQAVDAGAVNAEDVPGLLKDRSLQIVSDAQQALYNDPTNLEALNKALPLAQKYGALDQATAERTLAQAQKQQAAALQRMAQSGKNGAQDAAKDGFLKSFEGAFTHAIR
ncbi:MAG TPA: hypothetical protein V6D47_07520 [Oscillatoriaceae cyanobacterium]